MLADHKGEIPFVVYIVPLLSGIGLALSFNLNPFNTLLTALLFCLSFVFMGLNVLYRQFNLFKYPWLGGCLFSAILLLTGIVITIKNDDRNRHNYFEKSASAYLVIRVNNEPQFKNNILRFTANVERAVANGQQSAASGSILIAIRSDSAHAHHFYYGDEMLIPARYAPVDPPFNPAEFNYKQYLAQQNIYAQAFLKPGELVLLARNTGNPLIAYALKLRQSLIEKLKIHLHNPEAIAVASTLILGYKADLSDDILQAYAKTGTIHVLSVSGAHVAIIFTMIGFVLGFFNRYSYGQLVKAIIAITLIWFYAMLSGFSPAVCRSAVMISLIILGKAFTRNISTLNILAVSAFALLLYNPYLLTDVGFQLSYLSVGGLIVFQPVIYKWIDIENKWIDWLWAFCAASLAAQLITFPLSAYYFHQFPVYFLLSNLFILPLSVLIMYIGIGYFLCWWIPFISAILGWLLEHSILLMDKGLLLIEHSPYASIGKIWISPVEYILLYAIIIFAFYWLFSKKTWVLKTGLMCVLALSLSISIKNIRAQNTNSITFLNLKKHSAILFKAGNKGVIFTDVADTDKTYRYSIKPLIDSSRISELYSCSFNHDTATPFFRKTHHLMQFMNQRLLILNRADAPMYLKPKLSLDYILITGSPKTTVDFINKNYTYRRLIIDAGNSDALIKRLNNYVMMGRFKNYILKRNYSLILQSN